MLFNNIQDDLKQAQLSKDGVKTSTLRMLLSELSYAKITKGEELSDPEVVSVIQKEVKKRNEAAEGFRSGGREDNANKEESEAEILKVYLPAQLSNEQLTKIVEDTINELGASSLGDLGKVMGVVMGKVAGRAEGGAVSELVKNKLQ